MSITSTKVPVIGLASSWQSALRVPDPNRTGYDLSLVADCVDLVKNFGVDALNELRELGKDLKRRSSIVNNLDLSNSIVSQNNISYLGSFIPDTLIAANSLFQLIGESSSGERIKQKLECRSVCQIAAALNDLSGSDFDGLKLKVSEIIPVAFDRKPIWCELGASMLERFVDHQYQAYLDRLTLTPEDPNALQNALSIRNRPETIRMKKLLGVVLCDELRALGAEDITLLRAIGKELCDRDKISDLIRQVKSEDGAIKVASLNGIKTSADFIHAIADITHRAWMRSRSGLDTLPKAATSFTRDNYGKLFVQYQELPEKAKVFDQINALTLIAEIGKLSDQDFEAIRSSAPTNRRNISRALSTIVMAPEKDAEKWAHPLSPREGDTQTADGYQVLTDKLAYQGIVSDINRFSAALDRMESPIISAAFREVDNCTGGLQSHKFENILRALKDLQISHGRLVEVAGVLSSCSEFSLVFSNIKLDQDFQPSNYGEVVFGCVLRDWRLALNEVASLVDLSIDQDIPSTELIGKSKLALWTKDILRLVEANRRQPGSEGFESSGGVVGEFYTRDFFERYVDSGGKLLIQSSFQGSQRKLDGFILYYDPTKIPQWDHNVPDQIRDKKDISFADLILVSDDRPKGTFQRLFNGMVARLQLTTAKYSTGYVFNGNERSRKALEHVGHLDQSKLAVNWMLSDGKEIKFTPMFLPVDPAIRKLMNHPEFER